MRARAGRCAHCGERRHFLTAFAALGWWLTGVAASVDISSRRPERPGTCGAAKRHSVFAIGIWVASGIWVD